VQGLAGKGGMARVYRAWDPKHRRPVAIKIMNADLRQEPEAVRRFRRSARALYQLDHPHITRVYSADDNDGVPYLVLEYIEGASLEHYLLSGQRLTVRHIVQIIDQIAQALDYAHGRGVIHRDIKPSNILITRDGQRAVLSDFGLARVLGQSRMTLPGVILGTPRYMSPEQVRGAEVDWRTDIYALGVTCYELLTGQPAFYCTMAEIAGQILNGQYRPPSQANPALPAAVDNVIRSAMQTRPDRRFQTAMQLSRALAAALGVGIGPQTPTPTPRPGSQFQRSRSASSVFLILACVIVIVVAIVALVMVMGGAK
jgi:serine/threonine-protein kinase